MSSVLRTENLVKIYKKRKVVDGVSISVKQGEIVGLLGPKRCWENNDFLYDSWGNKTQRGEGLFG